MVSSFGSNRVVVASLPFSVMPLLRSEAETDEANFCQYVYVTQLFVKEKPADFFGLAEMEDVYESQCHFLVLLPPGPRHQI